VLLPADTIAARLIISTPEEVVASVPLSEQSGLTAATAASAQTLVVPIRPSTATTTYAIALTPRAGSTAAGERVLIVDLVAGSSHTERLLQSHEITIMLRPQLAMGCYLLIGGLGILLGYLLRQIIRSTGQVRTPFLSQPPAEVPRLPQQGWLTTMIQRKPSTYFVVDGSVTLFLGLGAMLALVKGDLLPDAGTSWHGTLLLGAGLGLLTNSDLLTRLR
jgi:hypothetical protein